MHLAQKIQPEAPAIPDRLYFKIGDVARLCGVESYVLRFWETRFPQLKPKKSGNGQRLYRRRDVELALRIKQLVHGEGYTLSGARQALEGQPVSSEAKGPVLAEAVVEERRAAEPQIVEGEYGGHPQNEALRQMLGQLRGELRSLAQQLARPVVIDEATTPVDSAAVSLVHGPRHRARIATMPAVTASLFGEF